MNRIALVLSFCVISLYSVAQDGWEPLFNGKDIKNFEKVNGTAEYQIKDGAIIGTSRMGTPNTFLATKKTYSDFILELDVKVENNLNSGIQIRSLSKQEVMDGRVHGYQVEIDPSPRAFSGGLYDEARRKWLYPLTANEKGRAAFRTGEWNSYRIEAVGNKIRTWVNGVMCTNLVDDLTAEGFIALQVHSINDPSQEGATVQWRNLRIKTTDLADEQWPVDPEVREISYLTNELTELEKRKGFRLLWDGKTSKGWKGAKLDGFPESGWQIEDGVLTVLATDGGESTGPGDIITTDNFGDFELILDFKLTEGANSGIKYFVDPELNKGAGSAIGCEFQILDDKNHPDAKQGVAGNRTLGSLYDLMTAKNIEIPDRLKPKFFKGINQWNRARIVSKDGKVEHWLNDEKVIEYDRYSQMFEALVNYSKYKDWPNFGRWAEGPILLQDHGDTVHFRSIKIREL
ncbi:MAG: DUF1080 domain-containing protein [Cyclobacteriaceae bacterium]